MLTSNVFAIRSFGSHLERRIRLASSSYSLGVGVREKKTIAAAGKHTQIIACVETLMPRLDLGLFRKGVGLRNRKKRFDCSKKRIAFFECKTQLLLFDAHGVGLA